MAEYIRFKSIAYDTMDSSSKAKSYTLFKDESLVNCNPLNINGEQEILQWLFSKGHFIRLLFDELGQKNVIRPFLEVPRIEFQSSPEKSGDFDVIYCQYKKFDELTCIEFKRVKVEQKEYSSKERINGLGNIEKLVRQGNLARRTGFQNTYIAAIALIDTSKFVRPNTLTKFEPTKDYKSLYEIQRFGQLDSEVGAILIEIEQPTGKDFKMNGQINVAKLKSSVKQNQNSMVTEDFKRVYFKRELRIAHGC